MRRRYAPTVVLLAACLLPLTLDATAAAPAAKPAAPAPQPEPNEAVRDAAPAAAPAPMPQPRGAEPWPVLETLHFRIDRVGRVHDVTADPTKLADPYRDAALATVERWRFWPALGACRYVEQDAKVSFAFDERQVRTSGPQYTPVSDRRTLKTTDIGRLYAYDIGDPRHDERTTPAGFVDAVPLDMPPPRFPAAASRAASRGYAFVLIDIGVDGKVKQATVTDSWAPDEKFAPAFGAEAARAIRLWKFRPAMQDGKPQPRTACQRFMFNMQLGGGG